MNQDYIIKKVQKDFEFIKSKIKSGDVHSVLLYGSYANNEQTSRSDIDICIVAPKFKTPKLQAELLRYIWGQTKSYKYDVRIFESFPIYMKIGVIQNNKVVFSRNAPELSYYFYFFRKIWNDQSINWIER